MQPFKIVFALSLLIMAAQACTITGTIDETTDTTRNITISTSGKTWFTPDGVVRRGQEVNAFANLNFENLKQDMAAGQGQYLASLATLLEVPSDRHDAFFAVAQQQYGAGGNGQETPNEMIARLTTAFAQDTSKDGSSR
jgi:hypothetical protein